MLALTLLGLQPCLAQNQTEDIAAQLPQLRQGLGLSVAHLLDPVQPGVYLSYHRHAQEFVFTRYQLGYLLFLNYADQDGIQALSGIRLRASRRHYKEALIDRGRAPFWEPSIDYRYIDATIAGDFSRDAFQFNQRIDYSMWQHSLSFNIIRGTSIALTHKVRIELAIGAGVRLNYRQFSDVPPDTNFSTNGNLLLWGHGSREGFHATLSVPVMLDLSYYW